MLVDDDEDDIFLVKDYLADGLKGIDYSIDHSSSFSEALAMVKAEGYNVFLFDYMLGEVDGLQLLKEVRDLHLTTPVIFLTGQGDEDIAAATIKAGATDYLSKAKLSSELLRHTILHAIDISKVEERRIEAEKALRESEARYRDLVTHIPAIICELSPDYETLFVNNAVQRICGFTSDELIGKNWLKSLNIEPFKSVTSENEDLDFGLLMSGKRDIRNMEIKLTAKDGSNKVLDWNSTRREREDGSPEHIICIGTDITELVQLKEKLHRLSIVDELTRLHNRRGFFNLVEQQLKMAVRYRKKMLLVFADMDGMKQINDTYGHNEGDRALIETAGVLKDTFRESDIIARIGGDEFVVLVTEASGLTRELISARLREKVDFFNKESVNPYSLSLSVGTVWYDPEKPDTIDELMAEADKLMYTDKKRKRNEYI